MLILSSRFTEDNYERWYREEYSEPNSVYDSWLLLNKTPRSQFDCQLFFQRYPGMKAKLPEIEHQTESDHEDDKDIPETTITSASPQADELDETTDESPSEFEEESNTPEENLNSENEQSNRKTFIQSFVSWLKK